MKTPRRFSWDPAKNERNVALRGLSCDAAGEFVFGSAVIAVDDRKDYGEQRQVALGVIGHRLHVLVFTLRAETCHVISLRKANRREIGRYVEQTEADG
ncbi:BrnT family toxin [Nitratireductor soli]|uniref:BrnT family toxin n=1 Tax=Nitratireductor soli TaxID=1670619 RepID=UPI00065E349F|nr:BrnT family toxin [Nitratireductor soli]